MTDSETLSIYLTDGAVWVRCGEQVSRIPAGVYAMDAGLVFGEAALAAGAADPQSLEPNTSRFVADSRLVLRSGIFDVATVLTELLRYAAASVGAGSDLDTMVLTHPSHWGAEPRAVLERAGRAVARNVLLVPAAVAARRVVDVRPQDRCVVVELERLDATVSSVLAARGGADEVAVERCSHDPEVGSDGLDPESDAVAVMRLARSVSGDRDPDVLLLTGELAEPEHIDRFDGLAARIGGEIRVIGVAGQQIVRGRAEEPAIVPQVATPNWLQQLPVGDPDSGHSPSRRGSLLVAALAMVLLVAGIVAIIRGGSNSDNAGVDAVATSRSNQVAHGIRPTTSQGSETESERVQPQLRRFDMGRVSVQLPASWRERGPRDVRAARIELIPAAGADRRIVVVHSELSGGVGQAEAAAVLAERIAERGESGVFHDLEANTTFAGRPVIAYRESPEEASEVRWLVVVTGGLQVSVGCQFLTTEWRWLEDECAQAVRTLEVTPDE